MSEPEVYRGHVPTVTVSRCGDWFNDLCPGDEHGCTRCHEKDMMRPWLKVYESDLLNIYGDEGNIPPDTEREWAEQPHPTELDHGEFLRQYGRCPDGCRPAEQLTMIADTPGAHLQQEGTDGELL